MTSFLYRILGAALLDRGAYEGIEADSRAGVQALAVVLLASVAAGVGVSASGEDLQARVLTATAIAIGLWLLWAALTFFVGVRVLPGRNTESSVGELLRTLGFAAAPGLLQAFGALMETRWPIFVITWIWMIAASVVAVRQALDHEHTGRAIAVCLIAAAIPAGILAMLGTRVLSFIL
jgi:hypothetical protein